MRDLEIEIEIAWRRDGDRAALCIFSKALIGACAMTRQALLVCGVLSSLLYVAINIYVPLQWPGYSSASQTVSELSAIGAPTRRLWLALVTPYSLLLMAFGWGVWMTGDRNRRLRVVGVLLITHTVFGLGWPPMHQRAVLAAGGGTLTDTLHIVWTIVTVCFMMLEIGFGAAAFGRRFRRYSIATAVALVACGMMTGLQAPGIQANLPTPWIGVWERINIGAFMVWVMVLAVAALRVRETSAVAGPGDVLAA